MANDLFPFKETADGINEQIKEITKEEELKKAALKFLKTFEEIVTFSENININTDNLITIYNKMKETTNKTREYIMAQYTFEAALNKFLNRKIHLIYITPDKKILYVDEENVKQIYKMAYKNYNKETGEGTGSGKVDYVAVSKTKKSFSEIIGIEYELEALIKKRETDYQAVRDEVLKRWEWNNNPKNIYYWKKEKKRNKDEYIYRNTFYWKEKNKNEYGHSKKINRGHIYQTYMSLIWEQEQRTEKTMSNDEEGVKEYWLYMKKHNLNSVSGIVKGDIVFFHDNSIQFAIKSGKFETARIGSYLDVAYELAYGNIQISEKNVQNLLDNLSSYSKKLHQAGLEEAEKFLNQQLINLTN